MASSSGSSYSTSQETRNFALICQIVVDVFRDILWQVLIHEIPAADLPNRVVRNQNKLRTLNVNLNTWLCGISPSSLEIPTSERFDVVSLYILIRNLCCQVPLPSISWGKRPHPGATTLGDDIERLRGIRNDYVAHPTQAKIDTAHFNNICIEIKDIVSRFDAYFAFNCKTLKCDFKSEIDAILTRGMDKSLQDAHVDKMEENAILLEDLQIKVSSLENDGSNQPIIGNEIPSQLYQVDELTSTVRMEVDPVHDHSSDSEDPVLPVEIIHMDELSIDLYKKALQFGKVKVYNLRVMVVGPCEVGKTTLVKRLLGKEVNISKEKSTEGIEIYKDCCKLTVDKGEWIVQDEDTELSSRLQCLVKLFNESVWKDKTGGVNEEQMDDETSTQPVQTPTIKQTGSSLTVGENYEDQKTNSDALSINSEKNDAVIEIEHLIKLINKNAAKLEKSPVEYAAVAMWDFAGQDIFYTTHQTFLTSRAVYLLVIDLSQLLPYLREGDECFLDTEEIIKQGKIHDWIEIWLNSIHFCEPKPKSGIPPVILVGTHVDQIPEKIRQVVIKKFFKTVYNVLGDKPFIHHLGKSIAIDNTLCDANQGLEELKKEIFELAKKQPHWGEEKPARWLPLEQTIMTLKASNVKVASYSLVEEMNRIDNKELELFLNVHHAIGTILYFSDEELRETIILDPQWMIDALKSLITAETFIMEKPAIISKWKEFSEKGKLTDELLDVVWSKENGQEFHHNRDFILRMMEKLNILARPRLHSRDGKEVQVENYFIAPCMFKRATPEVISPEPKETEESSSVLCYDFKGRFLPLPIFHRLIAACVAHWDIAMNGSENLIYCDCCIFQLDNHHRLALFFREHVIFARVTRIGAIKKTPSSRLCNEAKEFIQLTLSNVISHLHQSLPFELSIRCPKSDGCSVKGLIPVAELQEDDFVCYAHDTGHPVVSCDLQKFWLPEVRQSCMTGQEDENRLKGSNQELGMPRRMYRKENLVELSKDLISSNWRFFFRLLSVEEYELSQVEIDYRESVQEQIYQLLCRLIQRSCLNKTRVIEALQNIGRYDLADKYGGMEFSENE